MTPGDRIKRVIAREDLHGDAVPVPDLTVEDIRVVQVNEQLESADDPPQTDDEWLAWLAKRGVK